MHGSIAITGGGIAGLTTAIALQRIWLRPVFFEAAPVIKEIIAAGIGLPNFIIYNQQGNILSKSVPGRYRHGPENFAIHRLPCSGGRREKQMKKIFEADL